ncbi:unnamed protein product [Angiostrongylus costaricensis]|uniref:DUF663 domain-containing protein n=1 Tax=Angiostrongylus costaricensis TaxID=334426 RepID=A0A0R3PSQ1_ANGCS|nr:unnamed protein product [Angiostrongylus costaricensis]
MGKAVAYLNEQIWDEKYSGYVPTHVFNHNVFKPEKRAKHYGKWKTVTNYDEDDDKDDDVGTDDDDINVNNDDNDDYEGDDDDDDVVYER